MDLNKIFTSLKDDFFNIPYLPLHKRRENLIIIKKMLQQNAKLIAEAISQDFSYRVPAETYLLELFPTINSINYCYKNLPKWLKKRPCQTSWLFKPAYSYIFPQPLGVVGIIVPWNYPIFLSIVPIIYALAAGNHIMVKMSEFTPATGTLLAKLLQNNGFSNIVIINGDQDISQQFSCLPFNHLLFTGSSAIGKKIMKNASENLTPVTLELGGKSPAVISTTVDFKILPRLFMGKLLNAGQTCIAPDYLIIPQKLQDSIISSAKEFIQKYYQNLTGNNYSAIISQRHLRRLQKLLNDAKEKGATIIQIGVVDRQKLPFYLIFNTKPSMAILKEEIFGPILPILTYKSWQEVPSLINASPKPLSIYYFGNSKLEKKILTKYTSSGGLTINDTLTQVAIADLPFGGIGNSGMGQYHGKIGFDNFSHLKSIFVQRKFSTPTLLYPPYGKIMQFFLRYFARLKI